MTESLKTLSPGRRGSDGYPLLPYLLRTIMVKCKDCKFKDVIGGKGYCKRYPPTIIISNPSSAGYESRYPEVVATDKCGEGVVEE